MAYNITGIVASNTTLDLIRSTDLATMGGLFGIMALVAATAIVMINFSFYQGKELMVFAGFFISVLAGLFWLSGLVSLLVVIVAFIFNMFAVIAFFLLK